MMKIVELEQGTKEWLNWRADGVGASEVSVLSGTNPYGNMTPYKLWKSKLSDIVEISNPFMEEGKRREPEIRDYAERFFGFPLKPLLGVHDEHQAIRASFDGINLEKRVGAEFKTVISKNVWEQVLCEQFPHYVDQCIYQMLVCGFEDWRIFFLNANTGEMIHFEVPHNPCRQNSLKSLVLDFWQCVTNLTPPPLTDKDYISKEHDKLWIEKAHRYHSLSVLINAYEKERSVIKEDLEKLSQGENVIGGGISLCHIQRKGGIDYSKIPELEGVDLEKYRKNPSTYTQVKLSKGED